MTTEFLCRADQGRIRRIDFRDGHSVASSLTRLAGNLGLAPESQTALATLAEALISHDPIAIAVILHANSSVGPTLGFYVLWGRLTTDSQNSAEILSVAREHTKFRKSLGGLHTSINLFDPRALDGNFERIAQEFADGLCLDHPLFASFDLMVDTSQGAKTLDIS